MIEVSFLPVGHTHEDIDQFFSRIAVYLHYHNAITIGQLLEAVSNSVVPNPIAKKLVNIANFKKYMIEQEWLNPISGLFIMNYILGHSQYLNYKFEKSNGEVCLFKKEFTGIGDWTNYDGSEESFHLIKSDCTISRELFPTNTPKKTDEMTLNRIRQNIEHCSSRIINLGFEYLIDDLYDTLEEITNPPTYNFNWDINKYLNPDEEYNSENEMSSEDSFNHQIRSKFNFQLKLDKFY
jgi:hypothetical protein